MPRHPEERSDEGPAFSPSKGQKQVLRFAQDDRVLGACARKRELLRSEPRRDAVACRRISHERTRRLRDVDIAPRINRQIVRPAELPRANSWSPELANDVEIRPP